MSICANCKVHSKEVNKIDSENNKESILFSIKKWFPSKEATMPEMMKESSLMTHIPPKMCK